MDDKEQKPVEEDKFQSISEQEKFGLPAEPPHTQTVGNCYCGKERNLNIIELLCASCNRWFHESCIGYQLGKLVPFMMNYIFFCKNCSPTGLESFKKNQALFPQMCVTAIGNLTQTSIKEGRPRVRFSKEKDIIPFIEAHWEGMTTTSRRVTQSWHATVLRCLIKETNVLFACQETEEGGGPLYSLLNMELTQIKPNYDAMIRGPGQQVGGAAAGKGRGAKRKVPEGGVGTGGTAGKKGRGGGGGAGCDAGGQAKLPAHGYPMEHPYNKDEYRYILAEPDPHAPFRQEFDESSDWAGKPIPGWLYRTLSPNCVLLALHDRAPQLKISEDRLAVTGDKGYCMVRATHGVSRGAWYWEACVEEMPEGAATRLGWAQEYANLQAPLGYDKFGYSWRSRKGTRFHECRGKHYSEGGYGEGDVLGFMAVLPDDLDTSSYVPQTYKDRPLVKFKSHLYYEEKDRVAESLRSLRPLTGGRLLFFRNGVCQGVAFDGIYAGCYFPALSIHRSATVSVNFGPAFKCPPDTDIDYRPIYEKAEEAICEQTMADLLYLTENEGKLRLDTFCV